MKAVWAWAESKLVLAFVATIASFVVSTLVYVHLSSAIHRSATDIAHRAVPRIAALGEIRTTAHQYSLLIHEQAEEPTTPSQSGTAENLRQRLEADARSLPSWGGYPGEHAVLLRLSTQLFSVASIGAQISRAQARKDFATSHFILTSSFRAALADVRQTVGDDIQLNAERASTDADRADNIRLRAEVAAYVLGSMSLLLGALAAWVAVRGALRARLAFTKQAELQAERAGELERFSSRVSHDILGPLQSVALALELLSRRLSGDTRSEGVLARANRGLKQVRAIVSDLYEYARSGAPPDRGTRTEVAQVIRAVFETLLPAALESSATLLFESTETCWVACSPGLLTSIIQNLVHNALKYLGDRETRTVRVTVARSGALVHIDVEDTGPGMQPEILQTVFEPYVRGVDALPGLGLGLATVKRLVEGHGGSISVTSIEGEGCHFSVVLPSAAPDSSMAPVNSRATRVLGSGLHHSS